MKFTVNSIDLSKSLEQAAKFVPSRNHIPILANIKLVASDSLTLTGFNLSHGIEIDCDADVIESGHTCLPASAIVIIKGMAGQLIVESSDNDLITISNLSGKVEIQGMPAIEYPVFVTDVTDDDNGGKSEITHIVDAKFLTQAVKYCGQSTSSDESKALLTGINISAADGNLRAIATDGHRLSIYNMAAEDNVIFSSVTIPSKSLSLVPFSKSSTISISIEDNQVSINSGSRSIMRTLEGKYPDAMLLVPKSFTRYMETDRRELINALSMMSAISDANNLVKFAMEGDQVTILSSSDGKSGKIDLSCKLTGSNFEQFEELEGQLFVIAFNLKYLIDGLKMFDSDQIEFAMNEPLQPVIITPIDSDVDLTYLVMPVQLRH